MGSTYLEDFREMARRNMDPEAWADLHSKARGRSGGRAQKSNSNHLLSLHFDKSVFSLIQARTWAKQHGYANTQITDNGVEWIITQPGTPAVQDSSRRSMGTGIWAMVGKAQSAVVKSEQGGFFDAVAQMFTNAVEAFERVVKSGPFGSEVHVPVPLGSERKDEPHPVDESLKRKARAVAGADAEAALSEGAVTPERDRIREAQQVLKSDPHAYDAVSDAFSLAGGRGLDGIDIHLQCGDARLPGHLGTDMFGWRDSDAIQPGYPALNMPFPDNFARSIFVRKYDEDIARWGGADIFMSECARVLQPGGLLVMGGAEPIAKYDTQAEGNLARISNPTDFPNNLIAFQLRDAAANVEGTQDLPDIDSLLATLVAKSDGWQVHEAGGTDADLLGILPRRHRELIQKTVGDKTIPAVGSSQKKQIIYGVVLEPDTKDSQGDVMTPEEIEYTAHKFLADSRVIGSEHGSEISAIPVESFIAPQDLEFDDPIYGKQKVSKGSWVLAVKIKDPEEWKKVVSGDYNGFSVGGFGLRDPM